MHIWQKYSSANKALRPGLILALLLIAAALFSLCAGASGASFFDGLRDAVTGTDSRSEAGDDGAYRSTSRTTCSCTGSRCLGLINQLGKISGKALTKPRESGIVL